MRTVLLLIFACGLFTACSLSSRLQKSAQKTILDNAALRTAHVGISIYEPATGKWWYNYQGDKYFVPASNTKLATCYAAMKYLGDSLVGAYVKDTDTALHVYANGDPTFLSTTFSSQPLYDYLKRKTRVILHPADVRFKAYGNGWSWNDYESAFMPSRSVLPMYDGLVRFRKTNAQLVVTPQFFGHVHLQFAHKTKGFAIKREYAENNFGIVDHPDSTHVYAEVPFRSSAWSGSALGLERNLLYDTLHSVRIDVEYRSPADPLRKFYSQPTDSLLGPMMHNSDNFFAEQALLMVSNERLGYLSDEKIIDTLLKTDFANLPQKPRWVDGSGLSRYNLFTPQDFVAILEKMKTDFGIGRIRHILPTGNEGTLANYYKADSTYLYAKTGTLSGVVALSGFLTTRKGRELIFSVLVNNHQTSATAVRRAMEAFLQNLRNQH